MIIDLMFRVSLYLKNPTKNLAPLPAGTTILNQERYLNNGGELFNKPFFQSDKVINKY